MPAVSIILPCRDAARTLPETLASLAAQTCPDWELIAVDDGSTDATPDLLAAAAAADPRIRALRGAGRGPGAARNLAARAARGGLLAFLDADDLWAPEKLARIRAAFAARPEAAAVFARTAFFARDPGAPDALSAPWRRDPQAADLLRGNPACTASNLTVRAAAFRAAGGFHETLRHAEDVELMLRLLPQGALAPLPEVQVFYRASPGGLSADLERMHQGWRACAATARAVGFRPGARALRAAEACHLRYLARRALRLASGRAAPLTYALRALRLSPAGFFSAPRQGAGALLGALVFAAVPSGLGRRLFKD